MVVTARKNVFSTGAGHFGTSPTDFIEVKLLVVCVL